MNPTIIFDLDGTLSDPSHRQHLLPDWAAFFAAAKDDPPVMPIADLMRLLEKGGWHERMKLVVCTGRPEEYRYLTLGWLAGNALAHHALYMRATGDHRPDHQVKAEMLTKIRADGYDPWLVVDDRPSVVAMWRANGLTCLQCRDAEEPNRNQTPGLLTLLVGPSGAGKSTWLEWSGHAYGIEPEHVISSDQTRADLCSGDFKDQSKNPQVFAALHEVVRARVRSGLPATVDATNIRTRDRRAVASLTAGPVRYIVLDRPLPDKLATRGWRPESLIRRHDQTFRSNLPDILTGDGLPNVTVLDLRQ